MSYPTISAVGAHAALAKNNIPYGSDEDGSGSQITRQEIYLIDSGAHYKGK